jgi:threonylcarbamoyladenosine tRNA methylthiotransferase MtaB
MSARVLTFGCRLNAYESEVIETLTANLDDTVVVNTCAVTSEAERQARQAIRHAHRARPDASIVVTGCAAQIAPARWAAIPGVARVLANGEKLHPASWGQAGPPPAVPVHAPRGRARALVQVQQGCDHACTFCVIPLGRGPNRSVPIDTIGARVAALVAAGTREVVLTGVDIASYGADAYGGPRLGTMIRILLAAVPDLPRLRLSSLDPAALDEELWALIAGEPRLMPHLHLSLQSASGLVLKRMRRRHSPDQASDLIGRARALRPGIAIGADLIAGFPTETDALFEETLTWLIRHALPYLHVFPYSERPGTPAARMPSVPPPIRRERATRLRNAGRAAAQAWHARQLGQSVEILTEAGGGGHTQHFAPVRRSGDHPPGMLLTALVTGADADALTVET